MNERKPKKTVNLGPHTLEAAQEAVRRNDNSIKDTKINSGLHVRKSPGHAEPVGTLDLDPKKLTPKLIHEIPTEEIEFDLQEALQEMEDLPPPGFGEEDDEPTTELDK